MSFKQIAILGTTASGKSALALEFAKEFNAIILSLDSLSIYKEIDIASAKPPKEYLKQIKHFGINEIYPNVDFNVTLFFEIYKKAKKYAKKNNKNLIITGGSGFYLKAMLQGFSKKEQISEKVKQKVKTKLLNLEKTYKLILEKDEIFANKISSQDKYRMEKWLEIYLQTKQIPSFYLKQNLQKPLIKNLPIYEISTPKTILLQRVKIRTEQMLKNGLVDEVFYLEQKYSRTPKSLKAIGLKEVLAFLDGHYSFLDMKEKIITNTMNLAKRQKTFNKTQFENLKQKELDYMLEFLKQEI